MLAEALDLYANSEFFLTISAEATTRLNLASWYYNCGKFHCAMIFLEEFVNQYSYAHGKDNSRETFRAKFLLGKIYLYLQRYHESVKILTSCVKWLIKPFNHGSSIKHGDFQPFLKKILTGAGLSKSDSFDISKVDLAEVIKNSRKKKALPWRCCF